MNLGEQAKAGGGDFLKTIDFVGKNVPVTLVKLELLDLPSLSNPEEREQKLAASFKGKDARVLLNPDMIGIIIGIDKDLESVDPKVGEPFEIGPMDLVLYTRKWGGDKNMFCFRDANQALDDDTDF